MIPACSRGPQRAPAPTSFLGQAEGGYRSTSTRRQARSRVRPPADLNVTERVQRISAQRSASMWRSRPPTRLRPPSAPNLEVSRPWQRAKLEPRGIRLGWQNEFADTGRPITAALPEHQAIPLPCSAPRRRSDAAVVGSRTTTQHRRSDPGLPRLRRQGSAAAPTNHASMSACAFGW